MLSLIGKIFKYTFYFLIILFIFLSIIPYLFPLSSKPATIDKKHFDNSKYVTSPNNFMHYRVFKPDTIENKIVLIHGFSGSTFCFRNNFQSLVNHKTLVIALDIPPYGFSGKDKAFDFSDAVILNLIRNAILKTDDEINSKTQWVIAGHSLGANYLAKMVTTYPALFSKQIFIDGFFNDFKEASLKSALSYPPLLKWADVLLEYYFLNDKRFGELLESAYLRKATSIEVEGYKKPFEIENSASSILRWANSGSFTKIDKLALYLKPTLILWGKGDTWVPFNIKMVDTTVFKKIYFHFIDSAGHNPQETHSEIVNAYINDFIKN